MRTSQKYLSLICAMMIVGVIALPSEAAISFSSSKKMQPKKLEITRYLDSSNPDLRRALDIHNLMNEMPDIRDIMHTAKDLEDQKSVMAQMMESISACHSGKLGDMFKNPKKAWGKMVDAYEQKRQGASQKTKNQTNFSDMVKMKDAEDQESAQIGRDILKDVRQNPSKWGQVNEKSNEKTASKSTSGTDSKISEVDLEQEYSMRLMLDSLEKGSISVNGTTNLRQQNFIQKLAKLGIDMPDLDLSNKGQYLKLQKQLKEEKKRAISAAQKYIELLEKQDKEHPEFVQNRQKLQQAKQSRLSEEAQQALDQSDGIIQITQMSPVMQQKFVIAALEKDKDAVVRLTETNAMDVDQKIRERLASNKIITESQKQMKDVYEHQLQNMPMFTDCSMF